MSFSLRLVALMLVAVPAGAVLAQSAVPPAKPGSAQAADERERIGVERKAEEVRYSARRAQCYQRFAVDDCLNAESRLHRETLDGLKRREAVLNDAERRQRGEDALRRIQDKQANPPARDLPQERDRNRQAQQDREQRNADHAASRAATAAQASQRRQQFEDRQKAQAEKAAERAQRRTQDTAERERYERRQVDAEQRRTGAQRRNAARTKPPAAPLPDPAAKP
jgi:colicin import membrane protein